MKRIAILALTCLCTTLPAHAGKIENACLKSDRDQASRQLCGCIQEVADLTLGKSDQKVAAGFFADPHRAQEIRQSDRKSHEEFWQRYKSFTSTAADYCQ
ncbi:MAG: hypothetical protein JXR14_02340 [Paracoccaceae bacterium]